MHLLERRTHGVHELRYQNESPAVPGSSTNSIFQQAHFASFAIWWASRETFRLALFL
jgi:hypothetical protein